MRPARSISYLVPGIWTLSILATTAGIFSSNQGESFHIQSIRGQEIELYAKGLYKHMSADVAIQGIAQDWVTLITGSILLLAGLIGYRNGSIRGAFLLAGTLGYYFVTYLFYTAMAMFNELFLVYVALLGLSFFALAAVLLSFRLSELPELFSSNAPIKWTGGFLIVNACAIALLWLSIIIPPLLDQTIYPKPLQHYTTLIVQGFDLGLLLPMAIVAGVLLRRNKPMGFLMGTTYIVFLALLMTALSAKIIAMMLQGVNVIPAIFIIPALNIAAIGLAFTMLSNLKYRQSPRLS